MADAPSPPWKLQCPWCDWHCWVFPRGQRGDYQGSGFEAAKLGERHAEEEHGRTWVDWLAASR